MKVKLTPARCENFRPPADGREGYLWDTEVRGLCVRAVGRSRTYALYRRVSGRPRRYRIGGVDEITLDRAREVASTWNADLHAGRALTPLETVAAPKDSTVRTLGDVWADYLERQAKPNKRTWQADDRNYERFLADRAETPFDAIDRRFVYEVYELVRSGKRGRGKPTPIQAARLVVMLSAVIEWERLRAAREDGRVFDQPNPCSKFLAEVGHRENERQDVLSSGDFAAIELAIDAHEAAGGSPTMCDLLRLIGYTGLRKGNAARLRWDWVRGWDRTGKRLDPARDPAILVPADEFKGKRPLVVPLLDDAVALLNRRRAGVDGEYVFPGRSADTVSDPRKTFAAVLKLAGLADRRPPLRIHDLRGHVATGLHREGVPIEVIAELLGHEDIRTTQRYIRLSEEDRRAGMQKFAAARAARRAEVESRRLSA